mmetsp:Transcript_20398/g.24710  ORF Transcript_20398/g.24710 Transcript_20398/m.24710 type:complete len:390 (-) Transcript_20398:224-1393(-)
MDKAQHKDKANPSSIGNSDYGIEEPTIMISEFDEIKERLSLEEVENICMRGESVESALGRYLQARKFDIDKTEACIRKRLEWANSYVVKCVQDGKAGCLKCDVEEILQFYPGAYAESPDKVGRPIWYEQTGRVDSYALNTLTSNENFVRYHVCLMEELQDKFLEQSQVTGKYVNKTCSILDMKGFTLSMLTGEATEIIKMIAKTDSDYYPETMGAMFIINAPTVFSMAWSVIQGFLDPRTVSKIRVCRGESEWKPKLLEEIGCDNMPAELGGNGPPCLPSNPAFKEVTLASSGQEKSTFKVKKGDRIFYKFFTRNSGNISFKCCLEMDESDGNKNAIDLIPLKDYAAAQCSDGNFVSGEFEIPSDGNLTAVWEHPGWWSRNLIYRVIVK